MVNKKRGVIWIVLSFFLLVFSLSALAVDGCYYYSGSALYCTKVSEDQARNDQSSYIDYFSPGKECSAISTCDPIICNVNCQDMTKGECASLSVKNGQGVDVGWEAVTEENYNVQCSSGCCRVGSNCYYSKNRWECSKYAKSRGLSEVWDTSILSAAACSQSCGEEIKVSSLNGYVLDETTSPIPNAKIEIAGKTANSGADGTYQLGLNPGTYSLKITALGFSPLTQSLTLRSDETKKLNFTLIKTNKIAELSGYVKDLTGTPIPEATIAWEKGSDHGLFLTDASGFYKLAGLVLGNYNLIVSKPNYKTNRTAITLTEASTQEDFVLETAILQGIKGNIYLDVGQEKVYGASIYVDDIFQGFSKYDPPGEYEISLETGIHTIYANYYGYELPEKFSFTVTAGEPLVKDLVLTQYVGECSYSGEHPQKKVETFSAQPVLGEKKVLLEWQKPCPELSGYKIYKYQNEELLEQWEASPAELSFLDSNVKWAQTYQYKIEAFYTDVITRASESTNASITLGDQECESKYHQETGWDSFCLVGTERNFIWTCDDNNKKVLTQDCSIANEPGHLYFCAETGTGHAICKDAGSCGWLAQEADPFGLYYEKQKCYGVSSEEITKETSQNYCYFDYTKTILDKCSSCSEVNRCSDYKSSDACRINNCLGKSCYWIEGAKQEIINYNLVFPDLILPKLVTPETGQGYCAEKDQKEDECSLCGPQAGLFKNYFCTAEVCSGLGRCFSADRLKKCESCGESSTPDHNCYIYSTELECIGEKNPLFNIFGKIILSQDKCSWGRCIWQGIHNGPGACVKDGDGDGLEDCERLAFGQSNCKADNGAPSTKLVPEGIQIVSLKQPVLTFRGEDKESNMGVLEYCLDSALPNVAECTNFKDNSLAYPGRQKSEELKVNLISGSLKGRTVPGETFRLRYYSKDQYSNQENVKETFVFVDNEPPQFEINEEIKTKLDTTQLKIYLTGLNLKPAKCDFQLKPLLPKGTTLIKNSSREEKEKQVEFEDLKGIIYELTVSCEDDYGNLNNKTKTYVFDLTGGINILRPQGAVRMTNIVFEVETLIGSSCSLYKTESNEKLADFTSDSTGKKHKTNPIPGFFQGNYPGTHKVVCQDLLRQKPPIEDYFNFAVDFFASATKIIMEEGNRKVEYNGDWKEEHFVESVKITLKCLKKEDGFDCDKNYYCLTNKTSEPKGSPCYQEFTGVLTLNQSKTICYYSKDQGGNEASNPICGRIWIDGYGIRLVAPKLYWFNEEQWGISNQPIFDLKLTTLLPTIECKFNFGDPGFNYDTLPIYKKLTREGRNYVINMFPNSTFQTYSAGEVKVIYVKCKDGNGKIGPVQKINLEYDPTAPSITNAFALPNPIYEEDKTTLHVETDDKTLCKFDEKSKEYETMSYSFPGIENSYLDKLHETAFAIGGVGPDGKKDYALVVQCMNGAGNLSETKNLTFSVDYSSAGYILSDSLRPKGFIPYKNVILSLLTSKSAQCTYKFNSSYLPFAETGGKTHSQNLSGLEEKEYIYPLKCLMTESGQTASEQIKFTIDLTKPIIEGINNSRFSCSLKQTPNFFVKTNETALNNYNYELYDDTNKNNSGRLFINNGTIGLNMPFKISANLKENHTYILKINAVDQAGNEGAFKESWGFTAIPETEDRCKQDTQAPDVEFVISDSSCTKVTVEMSCDDHDAQNGSGCGDFYYGQSLTSDSCEASESYSGQKIIFEKSGWLCYKVQDNNGNVNEDQKKIEFHDGDGDGISNSCDQCLETEAGSIVDEIGCASGETPGGASDFDLPPDTSKLPEAPFTPLPPAESRLLAWTFLILGLFLVLGGTGYLIYYYKVSPKSSAGGSFFSTKKTQEAGVGVQTPSVSFRERLLQARKTREEKEKNRKRELLFGNFNQNSREIPHVEKIIRKEGPHLEKLEELTGKYMAKKEEIKPGLKPEEKDIFDQLEKISQQTKEKKIEDVVSKKEAKNIFEKLKTISEKRKKE